jgi:hypothetical protein
VEKSHCARSCGAVRLRSNLASSRLDVAFAAGLERQPACELETLALALPVALLDRIEVTKQQSPALHRPRALRRVMARRMSGQSDFRARLQYRRRARAAPKRGQSRSKRSLRSPPTLLPYQALFNDGTATAKITSVVGQYGLEISGVGIWSEEGDYSGQFAYGIHVTSGGILWSVGDDVGGSLTGNVLIDGGFASLVNDTLGNCLATCNSITATSSAQGVFVGAGTTIGNVTTAIEHDAGSFLQVNSARFFSATNGIKVGTANLSNISIVGNVFGLSGAAVTNGIVIVGGTSDYVNIQGNAFQNTTTPMRGRLAALTTETRLWA